MRNRNGITLVEVAVVVFCILTLLALLLPSVGSGPVGRPAQCQHRLRSLGQATINFEMTNGHYPGYLQSTGTFTAGSLPRDPEIPEADAATLVSHRKLATWGVMLLPYIDHQAVWERWSDDRYPIAFSYSSLHPLTSGTAGDGYTSLAAPNIDTFRCPSDPSNGVNGGRNSYVANTGMHHNSSRNPVSFAESMSAANGIFNNKFAGLDQNGSPVAVGPNVSSSDVKDGLSSTLLLSENVNALPWHRVGFSDASDLKLTTDGSEVRYPPAARYAQGLVWHYEDDFRVGGAPKVGSVHRVNGGTINTPAIELIMSPTNYTDLARPSSYHEGRVNAVFADGSTRNISTSIDYRSIKRCSRPTGPTAMFPSRLSS